MNNKNIKHFQIIKNTNLMITDRDIEIFKTLAKYHLTSKMVFDLSQIFASPFQKIENTRNRLSQLQQMNYLKRDQRLVKGKNSNEYYYFLTRTSAKFFEELLWLRSKNSIFQPIGQAKQPHSFLISEIMVKLELDANLLQDICQLAGFIRENYFEVTGEEYRLIRPDGTIFLKLNGQIFLLFLEVDRSTETLISPKQNARTFAKKIQVYTEFKKKFFWDNPIIHSYQGVRSFRVIVICKSPQRVQNLLNLAKNMNKTSMFWFTTSKAFLDENRNCLFDRIWILPNTQFYPLF